MTNRDREEALLKLTEAALRGVSSQVQGLNAYQHGEWAATCAKSALQELEKNEWSLTGPNTQAT